MIVTLKGRPIHKFSSKSRKKIDEDSFAVSNLEKKLAILNQELEVTKIDMKK